MLEEENERLSDKLIHETAMKVCWKANAEALAEVANEKDRSIALLEQELADTQRAYAKLRTNSGVYHE